jgi:hypothetical protein
MAPAWGATLIEIVRRKEFLRVFLSNAKEMANILSQFRLQEEKKRDAYKAEIAQYLPEGLISGLDDSSPYCEVAVSNARDNLPQLKVEDLNGFLYLISL